MSFVAASGAAFCGFRISLTVTRPAGEPTRAELGAGQRVGTAGPHEGRAVHPRTKGDSRRETDGKQNPTGCDALSPVVRAVGVDGAFSFLSLAPLQRAPKPPVPAPPA